MDEDGRRWAKMERDGGRYREMKRFVISYISFIFSAFS